MSPAPACPGCHAAAPAEIDRAEGVPVQSSALLSDPETALAYPRGDVVLHFCEACGLVFNAAFDPAAIDYAAETEESQHFSSTFAAFARELVEEIVAARPLRDATVVEIGSGRGEFLAALAERAGAYGIGIDPGATPQRVNGAAAGRVAFRREYFDPAAIAVAPALVVCRHTLEHVPDVAGFLEDVAALCGRRADAATFFETPDAARILAEGAFQDVYYEHCAYFTAGSHARLFRRFGMPPSAVRLVYGGQYIVQHTGPDAPDGPLPEEADRAAVARAAAGFAERAGATRRRWAGIVRSRREDGRRVAVWGAGSKAVSFLAVDGIAADVADVVDVNPHKRGRFLPGSGHAIRAPADLRERPPDTVVVMNGIYVPEIRAELAGMGLAPEILAL